MAKIQNPTKVITGVNTRWSYANVWDAKSINGGAPKYSVSLIIPKSDTVTVNKIKAAIEAAYEEGQSKLKGNGKTVPALSILKTPLRDGDLERPDDPAYANAYFINANSASAPGIVDADRQPILERSEVYSGVYGRASINLYAFNSNGNKGIACQRRTLNSCRVQFLYRINCHPLNFRIPIHKRIRSKTKLNGFNFVFKSWYFLIQQFQCIGDQIWFQPIFIFFYLSEPFL